MQRKTKAEIIEETANYYNLSNRGYKVSKFRNGCEYLTDDGNMCAVGRCIIPEQLSILQSYVERNRCRGSSIFTIVGLIENFDETYIKEEYRGHFDDEFWGMLQHFHDNEDNWTETGLSELGIIAKNDLLEFYSHNEN